MIHRLQQRKGTSLQPRTQLAFPTPNSKMIETENRKKISSKEEEKGEKREKKKRKREEGTYPNKRSMRKINLRVPLLRIRGDFHREILVRRKFIIMELRREGSMIQNCAHYVSCWVAWGGGAGGEADCDTDFC